MRQYEMHLWEWIAWVLSFALVILAMLGTFSLGNLAGGILLAVLLALLLGGFCFRLLHPEKYENIRLAFAGSLTASHLSGLGAVQQGREMELRLSDDSLLISDGKRQRYSLSTANIIHVEALNRKESADWEENRSLGMERSDGAPQRVRGQSSLEQQWDAFFGRYLVINYRSREGSEQMLLFRFRGDLKGRNFAKEVQRAADRGATVAL